MKTKSLSTTLVTANIILLIFCYSQRNAVMSMNRRLAYLENALSEQNVIFGSRLFAVEESINRAASLLDSHSLSYGRLDPDSMTIPVTFTIYPKEITDGMTVYWNCGGQSIEMEKFGAAYRGTMSKPLYDALEMSIIIESGNTAKYESFASVGSPFDTLALDFEVDVAGSVQRTDYNGYYLYTGNMNITIARKENNPPVSVKLVYIAGGEVIAETILDTSGATDLKLELDERQPFTDRDLMMFAVVIDSNGFEYRKCMMASANSNIDSAFSMFQILDPYGRVVRVEP